MEVDDVEGLASLLNPGVEDRPLPGHQLGFFSPLTSRTRTRGASRHLLVAGRRGVVVLVLLVREDLVSAEDDEVSLVVDLLSVLGLGRDHRVVGVGRPLNQSLQGQQAAGLAFRLLTVHLLETEDVGL